jgi:hypothetical protein
MSTENTQTPTAPAESQQGSVAGTVVLLIFILFFVFIVNSGAYVGPGRPGIARYNNRPYYQQQRNSAPPQQLPNISIPKGISFLRYGARMNETQRMQRTMMIIGGVVLVVVAIVTIVLVSIKKKKTEKKD